MATGDVLRPRPVAVRRHSDVAVFLVLLGTQLAAALAMSAFPALATIHVALTVGVAAVVLLSRRPERIALVGAYVVGVENLWRVTGAHMPYLFPSYLLVPLLFVLAFRRGRGLLTVLPIALVGLLLPSAAATFLDIGLGTARERVAFTVLPLVVLALAVLAFSRYRLREGFRRRMVAAMVIPTAGLAFVVLVRTPTIRGITFGNAANFLTSGGFGPVRISASLGLGALLCVLEAIRERRVTFLAIEIALAIWFAAESVLTFSRGGLISVVIALALGGAYLGVRRAHLVRTVLVVGATAAILLSVIIPRLDASTSGALNQRFSDTTTERVALAQEDLALFRARPLLGVGAGEAAFTRPSGLTVPSHTEFTRLLAEHGMFGVAATLVLLTMAVVAVRRAPPTYRWYCISLLAWCFAQMVYANLRLSAVAFIFGFACLRPREPARRAPAGSRPVLADAAP